MGPYDLGDPSVLAGLPPAASPVTASGEDPDEVREREASARAGWPGTPWALPSNQAGGQAGGDVMTANRPATQLTGGAPGGGPAPAPGTMQQPAPPDFDTDIARQAMSGQLEAGKKLAALSGEMQPDPQIAALEKQKMADEAATPNAKDPQYKVGFGTKVLRGLKGAGLGLAEHGIFGAGLGALAPQMVGGTAYSAPNDAYDSAVAANQKKVAADTEALSTAQADFKQAQDLRAAREKGMQESGTAFSEAGKTATSQEGEENKAAQLPIDKEKADADKQKAFNESADGKLAVSQQQIDARTKQADTMRMAPGYLRTRYILTGEIQAAREPTAEEIAVNRVLSGYRTEHGGKDPQTTADWQSVYAAAKGGAGGSTAEDKGLREAASLAEKNVKILTDQMNSKGAVLWSGDERAAHQKELDDAKQTLAGYQARLAGTPPAAGAIPQPGPAAAAGGQQGLGEGQFSKDGKSVMMGGKLVPATGKDGRVRMKVPSPNGTARYATFPPDKVGDAYDLGARFAGGQ